MGRKLQLGIGANLIEAQHGVDVREINSRLFELAFKVDGSNYRLA